MHKLFGPSKRNSKLFDPMVYMEEDEKEEEDSDEVLNEENYPVEEEFEDDPDLPMSTDGSVQRYS